MSNPLINPSGTYGSTVSRDWKTQRILERYPKQPDDPTLPPEMELVQTDDGMKYRFRDVGLRLEIDGETYVPEAIGPTDGYITLSPKGSNEGMVRAGGHDVKLHVDMDSNLIATGGEYDD